MRCLAIVQLRARDVLLESSRLGIWATQGIEVLHHRCALTVVVYLAGLLLGNEGR